MTIKINTTLSPELLITAPRGSPPDPSPDGLLAVYTVSTYSLDAHAETKEIRILDLESGESTLFSDDEKNVSPQWLVGNQLLWTRSVDGGMTALWTGTARGSEKNSYQIGVIDAPIAYLKTKELSDKSIAISFSAAVGEDGTIFNPDKAPKPLSSAREYGTIQVRFWDTYFQKEPHTLWYTTLTRTVTGGGHVRYALSEKALVNALAGTDIEFPAIPMNPMDGSSYDISEFGLLLSSIDPEIDPAKDLTSALWYVPIEDFNAPPSGEVYRFRIIGEEKYIFGAVLSSDGKSVAFLATKSVITGIEYARIFVVRSGDHPQDITEIVPVSHDNHEKPWDLVPDSLLFSSHKSELFIRATQRARDKLWKVDLSNVTASSHQVVPTFIWEGGSISALHLLPSKDEKSRFLLTKTSLVDDGTTYIIDSATNAIGLTWSPTSSGLTLGLKPAMVEEINFKGDGDYDVQAWVVKPSDFDAKKKYPLAMLIHGGPNDTWGDDWSTRWNPSIWTGQGYIAVLPNPSGSTSFGGAFAKAVQGDWGGRPYNDIVNCFSYVENNMPYVDVDRAIVAGASYGGYMVNWMAGQPLGKRFKAIISHDGIFSMYNMLSADVTFGLDTDLNGSLWDNKENWDKFDPAQYTQNWSTPMLAIHSDRDYRCPITEGLAVHNVCQLKGIESRFLNFPDENHWVQRHENSLQWYLTVLGWANKYANVKGKIELKPPLTDSKSRFAFRKTRVIPRRDVL